MPRIQSFQVNVTYKLEIMHVGHTEGIVKKELTAAYDS